MVRHNLTLLAATLCMLSVAADPPLFRAGLLSDTHVTDRPASCTLVRQAMALFRREGVDVICHLGDLADVYAPKGFAEYRRALEETFGDRMPETYYAFGGHDRNGYVLRPGETNREEAVWNIMRRTLKADHDLHDLRVHAGYPFVILREHPDEARARSLVAQAAADFPGKPVFVLMHEPAWNTTYASVGWGNVPLRRICDDFPQVVHIGGHTHGCNRNERMIWQGGFTEVNAGCLHYWGGEVAHVDRRAWANPDDGVLTMEVFADRIVFRRFSVKTGREYGPERPWTVPLPHNPATAPYRPEVRRAQASAPRWPDGACVTSCWTNGPHGRGVAFRVPEAVHPDGAYRYTLELFGDDGVRRTLQESLGEFWKEEETRTGFVSFFLDEAHFRPGRICRAEVRAESFFGGCGAPIAAEVVGSAEGNAFWRAVWSTANAMASCGFSRWDWSRRTPLPLDADGACTVGRGIMPVLELPSAALPDDDPVGTRYRLELTLDDCHLENGSWRLDLSRGDDMRRVRGTTLLTAAGHVGPVTYVFHFTKTKAGPFPLAVLFTYGQPGATFRVGRVAVSRREPR